MSGWTRANVGPSLWTPRIARGWLSLPSGKTMTRRNVEERVPFRERLSCSVADAVVATGKSRSAIYQAMKSGRLEFRKHGAKTLILVPSLIKFVSDP
jgi:hypothetical protein